MAKTKHLDAVDLGVGYGGKDYAKDLQKLQRELMAVHLARFRGGHRTIILFEGWDAAGKGGCIKRLVHYLDPRMCRVWPIAAPVGREKDHHYLYRFWQRLPELGCMAVFDRSWYGRVLVERVEGLATEKEWRRAYDEINEFERMLTDDGVLIIKFFLHVSAEEQASRFIKRFEDPVKRWKLTEADFHNRSLRPIYAEAIGDMLEKTSTGNAPWQIIPAESKKGARIAVLQKCIEEMSKGIDLSPPEISTEIENLIRALEAG